MSDNNTRNSVLGGMFWKFSERILTQGTSFVVSLILARLLSPNDHGLIALVQVFLSLSSVFITCGFATSLIQKKDADDTDFSTIFFCSLVCSFVIYGVLYAIAPLVAAFYSEPSLMKILRIFALQVPLSVFNSIQMAYISRHMLFRKTFVSSIINSVLSGAVGVGMALAGWGVWALVGQALTATVINTLILAIMVPWRPKWIFSWESAKKLMKYGSGILGAELSATFFLELRTLVVGGVFSSADLAYYNKGRQIPTLLTSNLSNTILTVMFPALANRSDDLEQVKQMSKRSTKVLSYVLVPCMFGLSAVMEPMILLLYTEKWAQIIPFGQILAVGLCVDIVGVLPLQSLKAIGRSDVVLKLEFWKKPVYVLMLLIGIQFDVFTLAVLMVLYDFYSVAMNMIHLRKYIPYGFREQLRDLLPAYALGTVMMIVVYMIPSSGSLILTLLVKIAAGAAIYLAGSVLFRVESFYYLVNILKGYLKKQT